MKRLSTLFFLLFIGFNSFVQAQMKWPEDKKTATEKYTFLSDGVKMKDWKNAREPFQWLLKNAPDLHQNLYIHGEKLYVGLLETPNLDTQTVTGLQDTLLMIYDLRTKYFNDEANVLNRKGLYAWNFLRDRTPSKNDELYALYDKIITLNPTTIYASNALAYMDMLCKQKNAGKINEEQVLAGFEKINTAFETTGKTGQQAESWNTVMPEVNKILSTCVEINCDYVKNNMAPQLKKNPNDLGLAKKMAAFMIQGKCTDDPLFMEVAKKIDQSEPSYGWKMILGREELSRKNYDGAIKYFQQASNLADNNAKKAEIQLDIAKLHQAQGQKVAARTAARKALSLDGGAREAYKIIGDLYFNSYKECGDSNPVKARAVFIAAYEEYRKAGDNAKMQQAKAQFPSRTDAFTLGMKDGQTLNTGCWIGETVSLQTRTE